jgi:methylated-DNA-[protein]-cysteine S-methyltransferase
MADIDLTWDAPVPDGVVTRFLDAAADDATVVVSAADAPFGRLWVAVTGRGVVRVSYDSYEATLHDLAARVSPRIVEHAGRTGEVRRELDEFFDGSRHEFGVALDWSLVRTEFQRRVLTATAAIPYGARRTYGDVAAAAGNERAVRAAGSALGANPLCIVVPCHRVLPRSGGAGGYAGGTAAKEWLLAREADSRTLPG